MIRLIAFVLGLGLALATAVEDALAERRAALVIGMGDYDELLDLEKAIPDARAVADKLRELDFAVTEALDVDRSTLDLVFSRFVNSLTDDHTAFIHFSGHGIEIRGENYLLAADMRRLSVSDDPDVIDTEGLSLSRWFRGMAESGAIGVFVIDACRDRPFDELGLLTANIPPRGLARTEVPSGIFVMYSAGYQQSSLDRLGPEDDDQNSVYIRTLLKHLGTPGWPIDQVARAVRSEVETMVSWSAGLQWPSYQGELTSWPILVPAGPSAIGPGAPTPRYQIVGGPRGIDMGGKRYRWSIRVVDTKTNEVFVASRDEPSGFVLKPLGWHQPSVVVTDLELIRELESVLPEDSPPCVGVCPL